MSVALQVLRILAILALLAAAGALAVIVWALAIIRSVRLRKKS